MLNHFFKLNSPWVWIETSEEFCSHFIKSNDLRNAALRMETLELKASERTIKNKTFSNVSFSKKEIRGLRFFECHFEDCLFIGSRLVNCEFHQCTFTYCNMHKIEFFETYIDPIPFEKMMDQNLKIHSVEHVNIGLHLFQRLSKNSREMHQVDFLETADFNYRLWKRYELVRTWRTTRQPGLTGYVRFKSLGFYLRWLGDRLDQLGRGYGWRLGRFFIASLCAIFLMVLFNYNYWPAFDFKAGPMAFDNSFQAVLYNTVVIITTLGLGDINPGTNFGLVMVALQALFGPLWLSLLASILIRRIVR